MRIMVVDDNPADRSLFLKAITDREWQGTAFEDPKSALAAFDPGEFDAAVVDLVMPDGGGNRVIAAIRDRSPTLPIVAIGDRSGGGVAAAALRLGVNVYLVKPVDEEMLQLALDRATEALRQDAQTAPPPPEGAGELVDEVCLDLVSILDVDRLLERTLQRLFEVTGAQGGAIWHGGVERKTPFSLEAFRGVVDEGTTPKTFDPTERSPVASRVSRGGIYAQEGQALFVPVRWDEKLLGVVFLSDKVSGDFTLTDRRAAEKICGFVGAALKNAFQVAQLQRLGLRDRETAAYNITYFIDYAGKEIYKARRYGRSFCLVSIQVDNLKVLKKALDENATKTIHRALIAAVERIIRDSDILARVTDDTFYLLLPETDYFGALMFARRVVTTFTQSEVISQLAVPPSVVVGAAAYPMHGEDFDELIFHCRQRQSDVRDSPYRRLHLEDHKFWDLADTLLSTQAASVFRGMAGRRTAMPEGLMDAVLVELARAIPRRPDARGLLYVGRQSVDPSMPLVAELDPARDPQVHVYLMGRAVNVGRDLPGVTSVQLPQELRFDTHQFVVYLTEHAGYAWLEAKGGETYHTSDPTLVEALVARLQEAYDLQRMF